MLNQKKLATKILTLLSSHNTTLSTLSGKATQSVKTQWGETSSTSIAANTGVWKYFTKSIPTGYSALCIVQPGANHGFINVTGTSLSVSGSTATIGLFCQNITGGAISCKADAVVVFVKSSLL